MNTSPWIVQLKRNRPPQPITADTETDVIVVGGGIAGITTAFFLLTKTKHRVTLLEASMVAHGATGHNAGQLTSYFEKTFSDLANRYGIVRATHAHRAIEEDARMLLEHIFAHTGLMVPYSQFIGYDGLSRMSDVLNYLNDLHFRSMAGLRVRPMLIAKEWEEGLRSIPQELIPFTTVVSQKDILSLMETTDTQYIAALPFLSGCMNSALFTEELAGYLLATYPDRFVLKEETPVSKVVLEKDRAIAHTGAHTVAAQHVVLCTNGFEYISIENKAGENIDEQFHHEVRGIVGYMGAYKEPLSKAPFASVYKHRDESENKNPYFYVTRRPFEDETDATHNLVCIGGPEMHLPDRATYSRTHEYPLAVADSIDNFAAHNFQKHPPKMDYYWHGLMGYTRSWVRLVGHEPKNRRLLYNLGCNGVGLLTSIYGSDRIARLLNGEVVEYTIFDPQ